MVKTKYEWAKQTTAKEMEAVQCPTHDPLRDFRRDKPGFYVLIRPQFKPKLIEVAICNSRHEIVAVFQGATAPDIYECIFRHEKRRGLTWFLDKGHCAYLGKELKKAELALESGENNYSQE